MNEKEAEDTMLEMASIFNIIAESCEWEYNTWKGTGMYKAAADNKRFYKQACKMRKRAEKDYNKEVYNALVTHLDKFKELQTIVYNRNH